MEVAQNRHFNQVQEEKTGQSELDQLRNFSLVVADTGDFNQLQKYKPQDSTTNPSLILQAAQLPQFANLIDEAIDFSFKNFKKYVPDSPNSGQGILWKDLSDHHKDQMIQLIYDQLFVTFGCNILKKVPGYVSTEVDAQLSFDTQNTVKRAERLIKLYEDSGISSQRILIKIAATWQGIQAGKKLRNQNIKCNMTLIFDKVQAIACAQSEMFLISPFVGRILDWYKKQTGKTYENPAQDPGVISVTEIFNYFKKFNHETIIMGASFRSVGQLKQLAGCDRLTIAPKLLGQLERGEQTISKKLKAQEAKKMDIKQIQVTEPMFRYEMNKNKMATDLLSAGIRKFQEDGNALKEMIRKKMTN